MTEVQINSSHDDIVEKKLIWEQGVVVSTPGNNIVKVDDIGDVR